MPTNTERLTALEAADRTQKAEIAALKTEVSALKARPAPDPDAAKADVASSEFMAALFAKNAAKTPAQRLAMFAALKTALAPL